MNKKTESFILGLRKVAAKPVTKSITSSLISIFAGVLIGFLIMVIASFFQPMTDPMRALGILFTGPFTVGTYAILSFGNMLFYTVPLIFTGLSVALAYKTGLFNIGAAGQFYMGTLGALLVALNIDTTGNRALGVLVWFLAILVGVIFGMIWGAITGVFKGFFNINEVIVSIMMNWIAANIVTWVFTKIPGIVNQAGGKTGYLITTSATGNYTPTLGLERLFGTATSNSYLDIGILIAIAFCFLIWFFLNKTTTGYSLKATGLNRLGARYAGIRDKDRLILSMTIAGGLAALGGCLYFLNPNIEFAFKSAYQNLPAYGFNGIPAALLANCNPLGVFFSALFIRYLSSAGSYLALAGFNQYFADIIIAIIIYLAGFSRFFKDKIEAFGKKRDDWLIRKGKSQFVLKENDINEDKLEDPPKVTESSTQEGGDQ